MSERVDLVNHPPHYISASGLEAIDVIEAFGLNFHLGNTVKYILRAGRKGWPAKEMEDCAKAAWYLARHMERLKAAEAANGRAP